jgi:hypothetical protein
LDQMFFGSIFRSQKTIGIEWNHWDHEAVWTRI